MNENIIFLSEMQFSGKIPSTHNNMRTEFAWMNALNAQHENIREYQYVSGYEHVYVIFPKGKLSLSAEGSTISDIQNPISDLLNSDLVDQLKTNNTNVYYIQEGPSWWFNDYSISDQISFYNLLTSVDKIYAHNEFDVKFYKGLIPSQTITTIPTLLIEEQIKHIVPTKQNKVIIGGNFARWYGGFQSYMVASEFDIPVWTQDSHAKREHEDQLPNLTHLSRISWLDWMHTLSEFKYAVHLMPTIAAGTFSLNCAYFGIPCIGNKHVDTQRLCHPDLCVDVEDIESARKLAVKLKEDEDFYKNCSKKSKELYREHYDIEVWKQKIKNTLL